MPRTEENNEQIRQQKRRQILKEAEVKNCIG
jgi:hypothetical protein